MASEFVAGLGVFKSLFDMAKGLKDINDASIRNAAVIELQEKILAAREQQAAALERIDELEKEVARFETWETEKKRYELKRLGNGAFVYMLKETEARGEPMHAICPHCYERGIKSVLQSNGKRTWMEHSWVCPNCRTGVKATHRALACPDEE